VADRCLIAHSSFAFRFKGVQPHETFMASAAHWVFQGFPCVPCLNGRQGPNVSHQVRDERATSGSFPMIGGDYLITP
jgi:hypothetical protein